MEVNTVFVSVAIGVEEVDVVLGPHFVKVASHEPLVLSSQKGGWLQWALTTIINSPTFGPHVKSILI